MSQEPTLVYIAGPISKGDQLANIHDGMEVWEQLRAAGFVPFCPHWSALQQMHHPLTPEKWYEFDLHWLRLCDAVLRMPGESVGADAEVKHAELAAIPVFYYGDSLPIAETIQMMRRYFKHGE